jgi:hypothetical protein
MIEVANSIRFSTIRRFGIVKAYSNLKGQLIFFVIAGATCAKQAYPLIPLLANSKLVSQSL